VLNLQTIPASAFEVLLLRSELALSGPAMGPAGSAVTFEIAHQRNDDDNFSTDVFLHWTTDVGLPDAIRSWRSSDLEPSSVRLDPAQRLATVQFTPPAPGAYLLKIVSSSNGMPPDPVAFTATSVGTEPAMLALAAPDPARGIVGQASGAFTVGLPTGAVVGSPVYVVPIDGGAGGWFTPSVLVLSDSVRSATFQYTPATPGTKQISMTNSGGLNVPLAVAFVAEPSRTKPPKWLPLRELRTGRR
jgi:hypothetical protein